jgi:DNA-binding beta-propeller fold protein YncE
MKNVKYCKFALLLIVFAPVFHSACITLRTNHKEAVPSTIFYPSLPELPRFQYLTTISSSADIQKKRSPFFKFILGDGIEKPDMINKPYGIDIFEGIIYVCDLKNGAIERLDLRQKKFDYFAARSGEKLKTPINLKIDPQKKQVLVADMGRKQILSFDLAGNFLRTYGAAGQFEPSDIDFHDERLYVCDVKGHKIHVLDRSSGAIIKTIGGPGSKQGEFFHPSNICISNDMLYVSDTSNFRVQIFDLEGNFIVQFGEIGDRPGNFSRNKGIAVDRAGRIIVVDAAFENIQIFDKEFHLLLFMLGPGAEKDSINLPAGIVIDYDNIGYFSKFISPRFKPEYLLFVTSNFGLNKINVYACGQYQE